MTHLVFWVCFIRLFVYYLVAQPELYTSQDRLDDTHILQMAIYEVLLCAEEYDG